MGDSSVELKEILPRFRAFATGRTRLESFSSNSIAEILSVLNGLSSSKKEKIAINSITLNDFERLLKDEEVIRGERSPSSSSQTITKYHEQMRRKSRDAAKNRIKETDFSAVVTPIISRTPIAGSELEKATKKVTNRYIRGYLNIAVDALTQPITKGVEIIQKVDELLTRHQEDANRIFSDWIKRKENLRKYDLTIMQLTPNALKKSKKLQTILQDFETLTGLRINKLGGIKVEKLF